MCGIGGVVSKYGKPNRKITKLMGDTMIERGPDNLDFSYKDNIELVHRRLSIIGYRPIQINQLKTII